MAPEQQTALDPLLKELRRLRRAAWLILIFCAALFLIAILFTPVKPKISPHGDSWLEVRAAMDRLEYDRAFAMAERIVARFPKDNYGYAELGRIKLILGDVKGAESYYSQAYELYPGQNYANILTALRQRIQKEGSSPQPTATP